MDLELYNRIATEIYTNFQINEEYAAAYIGIDIKSANMLDDSSLSEWIYPEFSQWIFERPPLTLYAKYVTIALLNDTVSKNIINGMLKAFNYYGSYDLVIKIAKPYSTDFSDFKLMKHLAKAYKSLGEYDNALEIYREVIKYAYNSKNEKMVAFYLVLLGKLYDDYYQKKGIHLYYHKLAYEKIKNSDTAETRIKEICSDCYAKADYKNDSISCSEIYDNLIDSYTDENELLIRYKLNYWVLKVYDLIDKFKPNELNTIINIIDKIEELINRLRLEYSNERVYAIRNIQKYSLVKRILSTVVDANLDSSNLENFKNKYQLRKVKCDLDNCKRLCKKYGEKKYYVYALIELVEWELLFNNGPSLSEYVYSECLDVLLSAIEFLTVKEQYLNSNVYIDVMHKISKLHVNCRNYSSAVETYNKIYDYLEILMKHLNHDYEILKSISNNDQEKINNEFCIFSKEQRLELISSLYFDFESLSNKLLQVGKEINSMRFMDMINLVNDTIKFSKSIDYHSLHRTINSVIAMVENEDEIDKSYLIENIRLIENKINEIRFTKDLVFKQEWFYTNEETKNYLSSVEFQKNKNIRISSIS